MEDRHLTVGTPEAEALISFAHAARQFAYAPYSGFSVGAALLCDGGKVYLGANIENSAFSPTMCAERIALGHAGFDGERKFSGLAVVGGKCDEASIFCPPCGVCRQALSEFCSPDMPVYLADGNGGIRTLTFGALLPYHFSLEGN